jgi:hypothetical protein
VESGRRYIIESLNIEIEGLCMPRYEYRNIQPLPQAEKAFLLAPEGWSQAAGCGVAVAATPSL